MIIGLTGKARSGKDTVAAHLQEAYKFHHYWFSKPMKDACRSMFGWGDEHLYGELKEEVDQRYGISPRVALQTLGTEWGRNTINSDLWILRAQKEIEQHENIVISDCRFDNEAAAVISSGGIVIEIVRQDINQVAAHSSESGISSSLINYQIENNGTLPELYRSVDKFLIDAIAA
ncbi:MAG: deoxynucleotide monophosphate kinase [Alteromonas sp.]|nr:deoxynucleotide monophosphate kinase [Alteromonas sp.]